MGISRHFRKGSRAVATERSEMVISDPVSQNYEYGQQIPPWMNSYVDIATVQVENYVHPARDEYYNNKPGFDALQTFGSTTWVHAKDNASLKSANSDDSVPISETSREQPERRGLRQRLFRNRGRNADGSLRDEYDDLSMPEWGIVDTDEIAPQQRRRHFW